LRNYTLPYTTKDVNKKIDLSLEIIGLDRLLEKIFFRSQDVYYYNNNKEKFSLIDSEEAVNIFQSLE
jgi:hypothetical protein